MDQEYYCILTNAGLAYEAQCKAQGRPIVLSTVAVGDGNGAVYNPEPGQTALRREVHRQSMNALIQDAKNPTWLVSEIWIPDDIGGWTVREVGIYTDTGILYAVGKYPASVKPLLASGSGKQFYVRAIFETSNATSVVFKVDNAVVMATRAFVLETLQAELDKRDHKQSVRVATVAPIMLSGEQNIDGVAVVAGDRVLVKDQAAAAANGIYVVAIGFWTRATDADSGAKLNPGATVPVESGVANADTQWTLKTDGQVVVGTTALVFQWVGGQNAPTQPAGDSSSKVANTAFVAAAVLGSQKIAVFDASAEWTVPAGVTAVYISGCGAGGGGGGAMRNLSNQIATGGGGGAGKSVVKRRIDVAPLSKIQIAIGRGGAGGETIVVASGSTGNNGATGGVTSFGALLSLTGGGGGASGFVSQGTVGGRGGSGWPGGSSGEFAGSTIGNYVRGGGGGSSNYGGGGSAMHGYVGSVDATGPGGGGGGGSIYEADGSGKTHGGRGGDGFLIVEW